MTQAEPQAEPDATDEPREDRETDPREAALSPLFADRAGQLLADFAAAVESIAAEHRRKAGKQD